MIYLDIMKILYDHQIFSVQVFGGVSRYFIEISNTLRKNNQIYFSVKISNNFYLNSVIRNHLSFFRKYDFKGKIRIIYFVNKLYSIFILKKNKFDVFHPTYYDPYFIKHLGNKKFVLTVYDMIHEKFPEMFSESDKTTSNKKLLVDKAAKIIAISNSTKEDLIKIFNVNPSKIEVIYLSHSVLEKKGSRTNINFKLPKKYFLYVGSRNGYKNFIFFLNSIKNILKNYSSLNIVCAGGGKFNSDEIKFFNSNKIKKQLFQINVSDNGLSSLYSKAQAFIFPSIYEGFGLPILESFAYGCPLICSNTSSFPEIASNAAIYFDPFDSKSIELSVLKVLDDQKTKDYLINLGYERLKFFSWVKTAKLTHNLYKDNLT